MFLLCPLIRETKFGLSEDRSRPFLVGHTLNLPIFMHFWTKWDDIRSHLVWLGAHPQVQSSLAQGFLCCHSSGESEARLPLSATWEFPGTTRSLFVSLFVYCSGDSANTEKNVEYDVTRLLRHTRAVHRQPGLLSTTVQLRDTSPVPTPFLCACKLINLGIVKFSNKKNQLVNCGNKWNL